MASAMPLFHVQKHKSKKALRENFHRFLSILPFFPTIQAGKGNDLAERMK